MEKLALILPIFIVLIVGCQKVSEKAANTQEITKSLSELQVTACDTAHEADTCDTRLAELGIVLKEDCCKILGKCC